METVGIGGGADCGMGCERGIDFDAVSGLWGVKYGTDSKNVTSTDKVLLDRWVVISISFLSSRISNEDTFDRASRQFI